MHIILVSHCGLSDNSGMHVSSIASEFVRRGHRCLVLVPEEPNFAMAAYSSISFPVLSFRYVELEPMPWAPDWVPDVIHVWSPREHVRRITQRIRQMAGAPVIVHMEDNEEQIIVDRVVGRSFAELSDLPSEDIARIVPATLSHPHFYRRFIEGADGYTCVIEALLEFKPDDVPGVVVWPGFDERLPAIDPPGLSIRERFGVAANDVVIVYNGNVHQSNIGDIRHLYAAVSIMRRSGWPVKLVKTGWSGDEPVMPIEQMIDFVIDLGFIERADVLTLLSLSDLLVQPGEINEFNKYRFPAKLPEFLVSGRPVVLPDTNIGHFLQDGRDVLKLVTGTSEEIVTKIERILNEPDLGETLGANGRAFALRHLTWHRTVDLLEQFYEAVLTSRSALAHKRLS